MKRGCKVRWRYLTMSNDTQPEIRFPGFTEDWEQRKLGDLGSVAMNKRIFKDQTSDNGEVPFFKIGTFGSHPDAFISRELFEEYKSKYPYPEVGDILISASGSIGRTVVYQGEDEYFQDSNIVWLKHNGRLDNKFLQQFYSIVKWQGLEGSTIKRLYNKNILDTNISVPTLDEQNKLGAFFEQLDDTIALHQRKLDLLKETKKGFLQKMFPKNGAKVPEVRFPGFTGDWEDREFSEIVKTTGYKAYLSEAFEVGEYPVIQQGDKPILGYSDKKPFENFEDVVLFGDHTLSLYKPETPFLVATDGLKIITVPNFSGSFLLSLLEKYVPESQGYKRHFTILKKEQVAFPTDVKERVLIGEFFTQIDRTITLHERELDLLKEAKKGFLQKMFV